MIYTLFVIYISSTFCRIISRSTVENGPPTVPFDEHQAKHVHVRVHGRHRHGNHHGGGQDVHEVQKHHSHHHNGHNYGLEHGKFGNVTYTSGNHHGHHSHHGSHADGHHSQYGSHADGHHVNAQSDASAPLDVLPMKEVRSGDDPALERDLGIQQAMKAFRSSLPVSNKDTNSLLDKAEGILRSAPDGQLDAPVLDSYGNPTGQTYREAAEDAVGYKYPTAVADEEFDSLVRSGVEPGRAKQVADKIEETGFEHEKIKDAVRNEVARGTANRAVAELQDEIQRRKNATKVKERVKVEDELYRQHTLPATGLFDEDVSVLKNMSQIVPPAKIVDYIRDSYDNSIEAGLPPAVARAQADRVGSLITDFNTMLRSGESPETALSHLKDMSDRQSKVDQRRELLQNSSPEVLKILSDKDNLIKEALVKTARDPDCRDRYFDEASQKMKILDAREASFIHDTENNKHIRRPRKMAEDLMDKTNRDNAELVDVAYSHPVVAKDILKQGIANTERVAEKLADHLDAVKFAEKAQNPSAVSALKLLDERKRQDELEKINKRNTENEQKMFKQILKDQEDAEVMQTEEKMAAANKARKILDEGRRAAEQVLKAGGSTDEAAAVRVAAENATARGLEQRESMIEEEIMKRFGGAGDPEKARKMAAHIAIAHSGENAVGKTPEEVIKKEQEAQKKEILRNALYDDIGKEPIEIKSVIPEDRDEYSIDRSVIKFPLKTFIDEEVSNVGEAYVKNKKQSINDEVRNKVTTTNVNSGLNVIETENGFLNLGENSKKIHIDEATAYFKPAAKLKMEKKGIKTDNFRPKTNQGEIRDMPKGETYYEVDLKDADLSLPSPTNPTPDTLVSNGKDVVDVEDVSAIVINKGTLVQTPWNEYSDMIKPKFNPYPNEGEKINQIKKLQKLIADEKRKDTLDRIKVNTITNPDGEKRMIVNTPYGVQEMFEETEGMKRLSHIDPNKNVAISETPTDDNKESIYNAFKNVSPNEAVGKFIEDTFNSAYSSGQAQRFVNPTNAFTGQEDPKKARLMTQKTIDVTEYYINDGKPSSAIKNQLIQNYRALADSLGMTEEDFIQFARKIPDDSLAQMISYNEQSESSRPALVDAPFFKTLQPLANQTSKTKLNDIIKIIFTQISKVTGKTNSTTGTTLEKKIVPNLKAVRSDQVIAGPNGGTSALSQATAPRTGSTVLSKQITRGLPRVPSGTGTSYPVRDPNGINTSEDNERYKVNPYNPYSKSDTSGLEAPGGEIVHNGTRPSPYAIVGVPIVAAVTTPVIRPAVLRTPPAAQSSSSALQGNTALTGAGTPRAGVAGSPGVNPGPTGKAPVSPPAPTPPASSPTASPIAPTASPIAPTGASIGAPGSLGIPSSPLK
ncbi:Polar tube protein 3 [Nosema bombycis CQ1]|uniref:Polar tube protein 3 n=1 Tax=Nosema bombycis (strain CQ1 / CVCC 102059) TaxID=578461 RepID=R0KXX2_NOSB1|nr:Polar tube protein 3 [Nosema bombycis CQ1]|eukprot:EOB15062.1 Polar tube protein 3 [Nosema bombycis CQ1]